jgi:predicted SAM-dependent methyltransferase
MKPLLKPGWTWDSMSESRIWPIVCERMDAVATEPPYDRRALERLGVRGLQFGSGDRRDSSCLSADLSTLTDGCRNSEWGTIYLVDGTAHFVQLDARQPLPFVGPCFEWAYAEHFIEHLALPDGIFWLRQVRRLLVPGGVIRVTTPDLGRYASAYLAEDGAFFERHRDHVEEMGLPRMPGRRAFMLNQIFQYYGHRWIYDADELRHAAAEAGFPAEGFAVRAFRQGRLPEVAALDYELRSDESIYVELTA